MRALTSSLLVCLALLLVITQCQKGVSTKDVVSIHASTPTVLADGSSLDTIYADFPDNTLLTNRGVTFFASSGLFANSFDTMSVFATLTGITPNKVTAAVIWRASLRSGPDTLSATNTTTPQYTDYLYLSLTPSTVDSIQLTPSLYTLKDTFGMQLTVTAVLANALGGSVSLGNTIQFIDLTTAGGAAGGRFVPQIATVDSGTVVVVTYFPAALASGNSVGDTIIIKANAFDVTRKATGRPGSTSIFVSP